MDKGVGPRVLLACSVLVALDFAGVFPGAPGGLFERVALVAGGTWISLLALRLSRERKPSEPFEPLASGR